MLDNSPFEEKLGSSENQKVIPVKRLLTMKKAIGNNYSKTEMATISLLEEI
jgi:hypothetical protein